MLMAFSVDTVVSLCLLVDVCVETIQCLASCAEVKGLKMWQYTCANSYLYLYVGGGQQEPSSTEAIVSDNSYRFTGLNNLCTVLTTKKFSTYSKSGVKPHLKCVCNTTMKCENR